MALLRPLLSLTVAVTIACVLATFGFHERVLALAFHPRDDGFFAAQYAHLLDVPTWRSLALPPDGNDVFGFSGVDGFPTLHHELHASPIKYLLALVFAMTGSMLAVQSVMLAVNVLAIAYAWRRSEPGPHRAITSAVLALLVLSPSFLEAVTFDLRPFVILAAFVVMLGVAVASHAPSTHLAAIAALGLLAREDAVVFLAIACVPLHLDGRERDAKRLWLLALAYTVLFHLVYVGAMPFTHVIDAQAAAAYASLLVWPALALVPSRLIAPFRNRHLSLVVIVAPLLARMALRAIETGLVNPSFVWTSRWYAAHVLLGLAGARVIATWSERRRHAAIVVLGVASLAASVSSIDHVLAWRRTADKRDAFWSLHDHVPPDALVVTDYELYQAFATRDRVVVWQRLPPSLAPDGARLFPASREGLEAIFARSDVLVIVTGDSRRALRDASLGEALATCPDDGSFAVMRGAAIACPLLADRDAPMDSSR